MGTPMGMKKDPEEQKKRRRTIKSPPKPRPKARIKPISQKMQKKLNEYAELRSKLVGLCDNKSELSGMRNDFRHDFIVEAHHITGRSGNKLTDPFSIIMLTSTEHDFEQAHMTYERKQCLLKLVKELRIKQGFKEK